MEQNKNNEELCNLAEIVGIMIGDGCLYLDPLNKYQTTISFNKKEKDYLFYVKNLFERYFNYKFCITEAKNELLLRNTSVFVGKTLIESGLINGNKVKNRIVIPNWIFKNKLFVSRAIRGIFDTDGCIYCKYGKYAQIQIKMASPETISSIRSALNFLRFSPTNIQKNHNEQYLDWSFYLSRQNEIESFFDKIKPMNPKHILRYNQIKNGDAGI
jgi:DNA-binding transcriptional regulator WhiA